MFIGWIMECVLTTAFSVSINGNLHGFFQGRRGLRQGDPLSPHLFTICLEMLSRSLKFATSYPDFNFHPKCKPLGITYLAYADDLLLLSRGDAGSVSMLMTCLNAYSETAGLCANNLKSNIFLAGVSDTVKNELLQITGFQIGGLPFRYLGIQLSSIKLRMSDYSPLIDKLQSKINSWPRNSISYAGRLQLIRSVLQGVQCYWMTILPFPENVIKKIYSACRSFIWGAKHTPVAWKTMCRPIECGGLGLRDLHYWNKALLCKILWNIQTKKDTLWIKWVNHYYTTDILNYTPKTDDSTLLKALVKLRNELSLGSYSSDMLTDQLGKWFQGPHSSIDNAYRCPQ